MTKLVLLVMLVACATPAKPTPAPAPVTAKPAPKAAPVDEGEANAAYEAKDYARCASMFEALADQTQGRKQENAIYNAACCHARDGKPDRAFALLDRAVKGGIKDAEHMKVDPDLESLHGDARWAATIAAVAANVAKWEASIGAPELRKEILAMMAEDQKARFAYIAKQDDKALGEAMKAIDQKTTARMKEIIAKHGWPGKKLVGDDGANAAWLLVQHADLDVAFQKECLALLEKALAAKDVDAQNYAYLYDRVAVAEKRPQRWGTQFRDGAPQPIEDEANVDARRKAIGLGTMEQYKADMRRMYGAQAAK